MNREQETPTFAGIPRVFISYSWDDDDHKKWVHDLAVDLRRDGIETVLDRWHAVPGDQLPAFMANAIRESDFVLIVCTPKYKHKAETDAGGVRYEGDIIQAEVLLRGNNRKFIPVLRRGSWLESAPIELSGKYRIDLREGSEYGSNYEFLLRTLHRQIEQPPEVGEKPTFLRSPNATVGIISLSAELSLFRGGVAVSADGRRVISVSASNKIIGTGRVKVWDADKGLELCRMHIDDSHGDARLHSANYCVAVSLDGKQVLSGSKRLRAWDVESGAEQHTWWPNYGSIKSVAMTPDAGIAAVVNDHELEIVDLRNRNPNDWSALKALKVFKSERRWFETLTAVAISAAGTTAICGSSKGTIRVWDVENGREVRQLLGHGASVKSVAITADGKLAVSASSDKTVKVWAIPAGREMCTFTGHSAAVNGVAITAGGTLGVSVSDDKTVRMWDLTSGKEVRILGEHLTAARCVDAPPNGRLVVSGSSDGIIKIWFLN